MSRLLRNGRDPVRRTGTEGFTLIEMLVVLGIMGMVMALVAPQVIQYLGRAKTDTARAEIHNLGLALDLFRLDIGRYPTQPEGLNALVQPQPGLPGWRGPYLKSRTVPADPWGRPYVYRAAGVHGTYDIYSLGADNAVGGSNENQDVGSW
jgi:general secretion pathway protein G